MAKVRKQRTKFASPSEVISTTVGLLAPQEGQEIKSTVIKYQNLKTGSKLYDQVREYLDNLTAYHLARYRLQQSGYALQKLLDGPLVKAGELTKNNHWAFQLVNKKYATRTNDDGVEETYIVSADIRCVDTPDKDFTTKLDAYLPREKADELELGFLNLGDINEPQAREPEDTSEGTSYGIEDNWPAALNENPDAFVSAYRRITGATLKKQFYLHELDEEEQVTFFNMLKKQERTQLYGQLDIAERDRVAHLLRAA